MARQANFLIHRGIHARKNSSVTYYEKLADERQIFDVNTIMHWTREKLFDFFDSNEIAVQTIRPAAVFTMAESAGLNLNLPGTRCKNLLVQNKKGSSRYLIVTPADTLWTWASSESCSDPAVYRFA